LLLLAPLVGELGRRADLLVGRVWHWQHNAPGRGDGAGGASGGGAVHGQRGTARPADGASPLPTAPPRPVIAPTTTVQPDGLPNSRHQGRPVGQGHGARLSAPPGSG
jgi:hypothetical protein